MKFSFTAFCHTVDTRYVHMYKENYFIFIFFSEKYFDMNKKLARDALDIYKKFLIRMDRVADFLKVAEVRKS